MDKSLLASATSADEAPTPGYMLNDIARMTLVSIDTSQQVMDYLMSRLKKDNCNVKHKVLVIIRHICRAGRPEFKREMTRSTEPVKACLQFRGPPDELRGDEMYRRVREAARETLDAIFDDHVPTPVTSMSSSSRIQGHGSSITMYPTEAQGSTASDESYASTMSSITSKVSSTLGSVADKVWGTNEYNSHLTTSTSAGGMVGISNPNFEDPRQEKSLYDRATEYVRKPKSETRDGFPLSIGGLGAGGYTGASNRGPTNVSSESLTYVPVRANQTAVSSTPVTSGYDNARSERAFGWVKPRDASQSNYGQGLNQEVEASPSVALRETGRGGGNQSGGRIGRAVSDGEYEKTIVSSLCAAGGTRPDPAQAHLVAFLDQARSFDVNLIGDLLTEQLNDSNWQVRAKALAVLNNLLTTEGCEAHREYWAVNFDILHLLKNDSKATVRDRALKSLNSLGLDQGSAVVVASSNNVQHSTSPLKNSHQPKMDDLLSGYSAVANTSQIPSNSTTPQTFYRSEPAQEHKADVFSSPIEGSLGGGLFAGLNAANDGSDASSNLPAVRMQRTPSNPSKPLVMQLNQSSSALISNAFPDEMMPPTATREGRSRSQSRQNAPDNYFEGLLTSVPPPSIVGVVSHENTAARSGLNSSDVLTPTTYSPARQQTANVDLSSFDPLNFNNRNNGQTQQPQSMPQQPAVDSNAQLRQLQMQALMIQQQMQQLMQQQPVQQQQTNFPRPQPNTSYPPTGTNNSSSSSSSSAFSFLS